MDALRRMRPGCYYTRERHAVVLQEMKPTKRHFRSALRRRWCRLQKKKKKKKIQIFHYCLNVNRVVSISKFPNKFARLKIWINVNIRGLFFALALVMADDVPCSWRVLSLSKINRSVFEHLMTHQGVHYQKWRNLSKDSEFFPLLNRVLQSSIWAREYKGISRANKFSSWRNMLAFICISKD